MRRLCFSVVVTVLLLAGPAALAQSPNKSSRRLAIQSAAAGPTAATQHCRACSAEDGRAIAAI
jgi:hypothetical protein